MQPVTKHCCVVSVVADSLYALAGQPVAVV